MRLPGSLLVVSAFVLTATFCLAENGVAASPDAKSPSVSLQTQTATDNMALVPQMFFPPHATYKGQIPAVGQGPGSEKSLCYNIHSVVVAEDDHTGVTHKVRESTCTRATRFQTKDADAPK